MYNPARFRGLDSALARSGATANLCGSKCSQGIGTNAALDALENRRLRVREYVARTRGTHSPYFTPRNSIRVMGHREFWHPFQLFPYWCTCDSLKLSPRVPRVFLRLHLRITPSSFESFISISQKLASICIANKSRYIHNLTIKFSDCSNKNKASDNKMLYFTRRKPTSHGNVKMTLK